MHISQANFHDMLHPYLMPQKTPKKSGRKNAAVKKKQEPRQHVFRDKPSRMTYVSITGNREQNEDAANFSAVARVFGLFDGWGGKEASQQAASLLPTLAEAHDMQGYSDPSSHIRTILHRMNAHFAVLPASPDGCTAVLAQVVDDHRIAVGLVGDSEAFVMDCQSGGLAVPRCTRIHDTALGSPLCEAGGNLVAAVAPHGLCGFPVYDGPSYALHFEPNPRLPTPMIEMPLTDYPFCRDISCREVQLRAHVRSDASIPRVHLPHPQQVAPTPRIVQSTEPTRSIGADALGRWTKMSQEEGVPPLTDPEVYLWEFETLQDKWLVLHCDGLYNNEAFRGPKSVAKFLACPYLFIAQDLLVSHNVWVHELCAAGQQAVLYRLNLLGLRILNEPERRRMLLVEFIRQLYGTHGKRTTRAMDEALQYLLHWALIGNLNGLSSQEEDAAETLLALVHMAILMKSDDNISIMACCLKLSQGSPQQTTSKIVE
jgi:serine/threonine protein phosphatase PrpC